MAFEEVVTTETGNYPKKDFNGIFEKAEINDYGRIAFLFDNPENPDANREISIGKLEWLNRINEEGQRTTGSSFDIGKFTDSLNKFGGKMLVDLEDELVKIEPDSLTGKRWYLAANTKEVIKDGEKKDYQHWIVTQINDGEGSVPNETAIPTPATTPGKVDLATTDEWEELIITDEWFNESHKEVEIMKHLKDPKTGIDRIKQTKLNRSRKTSLTALVDSGVLTIDGDGLYRAA